MEIMEIKKVLLRKDDGTKLVIIPRNSEIKEGDYVKIIKVVDSENKPKILLEEIQN